MDALNKVNVLMPNAVSDTVSHSTLTDTLSPLLRETFKYTVVLASSTVRKFVLNVRIVEIKKKCFIFIVYE